MAKTAYLAGPDVFKHNRSEVFAGYRETCRELGIHALTPLDLTLDDPRRIFLSNLDLIDRADVVIANISPFRGPHCDAGTSFEIGYAAARGVPVVAFSENHRKLAGRIPLQSGGQFPVDTENYFVENYGLRENLMVAEALADRVVYDSFEAAAQAAAIAAPRVRDDTLATKDWEECRTTIGRFDGVLVDLRKFGFSIITGLLTVMFGYFGLEKAAAAGSVNATGAGALFIAIMVLIAALFGVDANFQVLLRAAVRRARQIEQRFGYQLQVTEQLSLNAMASGVNYVTLYVYLVLLLTAAAFGLLAANALSPVQPTMKPDFQSAGSWALIAGVIVVVALVFVHSRSPRWPWKSVLIEGFGLWAVLTGATVLAKTIVYGDAPKVMYFVVGAGALFALFVQIYWIFLDTRIGLTYDKQGR